MFCRNCEIQLGEQAIVWVGCGAGTGNRFCHNCGRWSIPPRRSA
jgi:hypothetical protein